MSLRFHRNQIPQPPADPIDHPALRRMTPRELADLPMPRPAESQRPGRLRCRSA